MNAPVVKRDGIVNPEEFSHILADWLDSCVDHEQEDVVEWVSARLRQTLPELTADTAGSIAEDIAAYATSITAARDDLEQARARGMGRGEWLYRRLKTCMADRDEHEFGQIVGTMSNALLGELEKTVNAADCRTETGEQRPPVILTPDVLPPTIGWNEDAIRERVHDASKLMDMLSVIGGSTIDDNVFPPDSVAVRVARPDKLKDMLTRGDKRTIVAVAAALKEAEDKRAFSIDEALPALKNIVLPEGESQNSLRVDIPAFTGMAAESVEYVRLAEKVATGEIQAEDVLDHVVDSATATATGIAEEVIPKYGAAAGAAVGRAIGGLLASWFPAAPVIGAKVGRVVGGLVGEAVVQPVKNFIGKAGNAAKKIGREIIDSVRSVGRDLYQGAKDFVSSALNTFCSLF